MNLLASLYEELVCKCEEIDKAWKGEEYSLAAFPDIVLASTSRLDLTPFGKLDELIQLLSDPTLARLQQLSSFSDLYIKLYDNGRFWVEILNWWGSDINIHDHDFAGIQFQLCGCSLNVDYSFAESQKYDDLCFGTVSVTGARIWRPGDRSVSLPGRKTPHNVCHLDLPTVSLLIRTHPVRSFGPQWNYFPPGTAGNYGIADATFRKSVAGLRLLARGDRAQFRRAFSWHVAHAKPAQLLFTLIKMIDIVFEPEFVDVVHDIAAVGDPLQEGIIEAAAFHRAIEALKAFRHRSQLSWSERVALAIMGSSFDSRSIEDISDNLGANECEGDALPVLCSLGNKSEDARTTIDTALSLFQLNPSSSVSASASSWCEPL
jgi:hypothetical protein